MGEKVVSPSYSSTILGPPPENLHFLVMWLATAESVASLGITEGNITRRKNK